jgi:RNA polymerase sigma-70 factor, ECF subfamily
MAQQNGTGIAWPAVPEPVVLDAARAGDADALDELVRRHARRAFVVAYRLLGNREDAEDLLQDSFVAALRALDTFENGRPFQPWLLRIVVNRGTNARKARALRSTAAIPADTAARGTSPLDAAERSELRDWLRRALDGLPERRRQIMELFDVDGFSAAEIAAMMDVAEGTVRWHVHEARRALRAAMEPYRRTMP